MLRSDKKEIKIDKLRRLTFEQKSQLGLRY